MSQVTYQRKMSVFWWVHKPTYFLFVMRELSSLFVAWFVVYLLLFITAVHGGEEDYETFLDRASHPAMVAVNVVAFAFIVLHAITWFALTPQAMVLKVGKRQVPGAVILAAQYLGLAVVSAFVYWLVDPMTKRRILPLVWLTFSGGGVIAAMFLPILAVLFAFAIPLGWITVSLQDLQDLFGNLIVQLVLLGLFVPMLVHAAHRFRYTLYDGLQVKHKALVALACYGTAALVVLVGTLTVLTDVTLA